MLASFVPVFAFAQNNTLQEPTGPGADSAFVKCDGTKDNPCTFDSAVELIQNGLQWILMFSGFIAAAMFMYAGFLLLTSAGNATQIQKAKGVFKRVLIGFLIIFLTFVTISELLKRIGADAFLNIISK